MLYLEATITTGVLLFWLSGSFNTLASAVFTSLGYYRGYVIDVPIEDWHTTVTYLYLEQCESL